MDREDIKIDTRSSSIFTMIVSNTFDLITDTLHMESKLLSFVRYHSADNILHGCVQKHLRKYPLYKINLFF